MKTLNEHEDFYSRLCDNAERLIDRIEAKLNKGEAIPSEALADMTKAVSCMMRAEEKAISGMRHHGHTETL